MKERLREILSPVLASLNVDVLDITRQGKVVRIVLDREDGVIGIDDCTEVSRFLTHALEVDDPIPGDYRLEVSSPGLDRPLKRPDEFRRFAGKLCRVKVLTAIDGNHVLVGRILGATDTRITLQMADGTERDVEFDNVSAARLEIEF